MKFQALEVRHVDEHGVSKSFAAYRDVEVCMSNGTIMMMRSSPSTCDLVEMLIDNTSSWHLGFTQLIVVGHAFVKGGTIKQRFEWRLTQ